MLAITAIIIVAVFYTGILSLFFVLILKTFTLLAVSNKAESKFLTLTLKITLSNNITIYDDFETVLKLTFVTNTYFVL